MLIAYVFYLKIFIYYTYRTWFHFNSFIFIIKCWEYHRHLSRAFESQNICFLGKRHKQIKLVMKKKLHSHPHRCFQEENTKKTVEYRKKIEIELSVGERNQKHRKNISFSFLLSSDNSIDTLTKDKKTYLPPIR